MKKLLRTVVITVLSVVLLFSLQGMSAVKHTAPDPLGVYDDEFYTTLTESIETYNNILDGLNSEVYSVSSENGKNYNDCYGGAYIDEETGELIVLVTELAPTATDEISTYAEGSENVRYQLCDVSYAEITEAIDTVTDHLAELYDCGVDITSVRDDILNGRVVISVVDLDQEKEAAIKAVADYDFLVLEDSEGGNPEASYAIGSQINTIREDALPGTYDGSSSLGFAARMDGQEGFVVSGHAGWVYGQTFKSGNTVLGHLTKTAAYSSTTTADASFVNKESGISITNSLGEARILSASTYQLPVNTPILLIGYVTGGTSGKVCGTNGTAIYTRHDGQRMYISNCTYGDYSSSNGDSGGPVVRVSAQGGNTYYTLAGIHVGTFNGYKYFSPYSNIVNELGVSCIIG